jgi:hypothetical protein
MPQPGLIAELDWLAAQALEAGADPERVRQLAVALAARLESEDPRRRRTQAMALRVQRARIAGVAVPLLCERFGKSRSQIHRLLAVAQLHATPARSNRSNTEGDG